MIHLAAQMQASVLHGATEHLTGGYSKYLTLRDATNEKENKDFNRINILQCILFILQLYMIWLFSGRDKWVPVTTAWRVLRLRMEERPPIWRVAANMNK